MPDYDVEALGLANPPPAAPVASYRPAVLVRNNGIHPADVTGTMRVYHRAPPGKLVQTLQLSLLNLSPGASGSAVADGYWTAAPADVGLEFLFTADVTTPHDQKESNNHLSPVTVIVTAVAPPPPPPVQAHATQHEAGGADVIIVDGLHGALSDPQTAKAHKATHQAGGSDVLNVDGLPGVLLQGQPIADHHETHELHGVDQMYVGGLHGELADNQPAKVHDNSKHDPNYTTVTEFNNHLADTTKVHEAATNLEQTTNKGKANGYPSLNDQVHVPVAQLGIETTPPRPADSALLHDGTWDYPKPAIHGNEVHDPEFLSVNDTTYLRLTSAPPLVECNRNTIVTALSDEMPANYLEPGDKLHIDLSCLFRSGPPAAPSIILDIKQASSIWTEMFTLTPDALLSTYPDFYQLKLSADIICYLNGLTPSIGSSGLLIVTPLQGTPTSMFPYPNGLTYFESEPLTVRVRYSLPDVADAYGWIAAATIDRARPYTPPPSQFKEAAAELPALKEN